MPLKRYLRFFYITSLLFCGAIQAKTVEYQLIIGEKIIEITGVETTALAINGAIPGPTLKAEVGDTLRVTVTNTLNEDTSIHWHGVLVPNDMDGVPYINSPPIKAGQSFVYEFPIKHKGTYWYHAHSGFQEQRGVYGALVFHTPDKKKKYDEEYEVILSDWTHENPDQVQANLKKDSDYYALKKGSVQSWDKVIANGWDAVKMRIEDSFDQMGPMDISDVGYDAFLINGKQVDHLSQAQPGSRIKLRIINAGASSYFFVEYSGGPMEVVAADGVDVAPFTAQRMRIAMAETYDVIVTVPDQKKYELRASSEDGTGYATATIGSGALIPAPTVSKPNLFLMMMDGENHGAMEGMDMGNPASLGDDATPRNEMKNSNSQEGVNPSKNEDHSENTTMDMKGMNHAGQKGMDMIMPQPKQLPHVDFLNNYNPLKSATMTTLPKNNPTRTVTLKLTGSMERYVWTNNNVPMYDSDKILIKKGENVKFILVNETMMHHPIHIHGHFFRVLNGQGEYSPLKHTVNVAPFETVEIEFEANEEKDWIFHCHNLYHMSLGMGGIIHYEGSEDNHQMETHANHSHDHGDKWFRATSIDGYSNFIEGTNKFMRNDDNFIFYGRHNYERDREAEVYYKRYIPQISQLFGIYAGGDFNEEGDDKENRSMAGLEYTFPFLVVGDLRVNHKGRVRFQASNEHQLMDRLSFDWEVNTDHEYTLGLNYAITKMIYVSGNYDSREQFGVGLSLRF